MSDYPTALHRIEVTRDEWDDIDTIRFICEGDQSARCRNYPDCECEEWTPELHGWDGKEPEPGHEDVPQDECWMAPWFGAWDDFEGEWLEAFEDTTGQRVAPTRLRSGLIEATFNGDEMSWEYVDHPDEPPLFPATTHRPETTTDAREGK